MNSLEKLFAISVEYCDAGGNIQKQELYAKHYHVHLVALFREAGEDVTSQVLKAYRTAIKPRIKDYLPNKEVLLDAAIRKQWGRP